MMISLRKSVDDLDESEKREAFGRSIRECYRLAIHSAGHYAVEVDPALAVEFRDHLKGIEEQSLAAFSAELMYSAQSSFRGELREYRDKSAAELLKLRSEVENASAAMTIFAETVAHNGENHDTEIGTQLRALESSARSNDLQQIRAGIGAAVTGIRSSVDKIQQNNQIVLAQLQDEIRVLHLQMARERKSLFTDRSSGAWNRQKMDIHLDNLLRQNQPFCLLLVSIRNLKRVEGQHSRTVVEGTLKGLVGRFATIAGNDAVIGRWAEDQFIAVLDVMPGLAISLSAEATHKLSGTYSVQENGFSRNVAIQATAGVIDSGAHADPSTFRQKIEQLAAAVSGG